MRRIHAFLFALSIACAVLASSWAESNFNSVEAVMDKMQEWKMTGVAAEASKLELSDQKKNNIYPLVLKYQFKPNVNDYLFLEQNIGLPSVPKRARMTIFGDAAGESIRLNFNDSSGEFFQAFIAKVDWEGWKDVDVPLDFPVHWGGDNNGKIDGAVTFHSIVVNSEKGQTRWAGQIAFAHLEILTEAHLAGPVAAGRSNTVTVDDFERPNPLNVYQTWRGDNSSIDLLSSSEFKQGGNFSMLASYKLSTTRSDPSWVSMSFTPDRPLNWEKVRRVTLWVKGDGTRNYFRINFIDGQDRIWVYQNNNVLKNVGWTKLEADLADFNPAKPDPGAVPDLSKIRKYEFMIVGEQSADSSGKVWLDDFMAVGTDLDPAVVAPRAAITQEAVEKTKLQFGDLLHMEYRQTPEFNKEFLYYNNLQVRGTAKNLSLGADMVSQQTEAGKSIPFTKSADQPTAPAVDPTEVRPPVELAYINSTIQNLHPNLASLSLGNLYVDYGRDVFSPLYGFKGLQADGSVGEANYNFFAIKHIFDSFTFGLRAQTNYKDTLIRGMMVLHDDTARKLGTAQINEDGTLSVPTNQDVITQAVSGDRLYFTDIDRSFLEGKIDLNGAYAIDYFTADAIKDVTNLTNPTIDSRQFTPVQQTGQMYQANLRLKEVPLSGQTLILGYRNFEQNYKPRFRADPLTYDSDISDVRGYSVDFTQIIGRFKANLFYDNVDRGSDASGYYRRVLRQTYGIYGINRFDVVFTVNMRREFYALGQNYRSEFFIDPANPKNEDAVFYELFLGNWFTEEFYVWAKFNTETTDLVSQKSRVRKDLIQIQGEYAIYKNAKLTLKVIQTRFDQKSFEPFSTQETTTTGALAAVRNIEDNIVSLSLDVNF